MNSSVFVFSQSLRHGALTTLDASSDNVVSAAASVAAEQLLRQQAFTEGLEVALLGRRWRIASQAARLACARGELSFAALISTAAPRIPFREAKKDPLFALLAALGAGDRLASTRAELLGFAAVAANNVGESDEDDLLHTDCSAPDGAQERKLWAAFIGLVSRRMLEDWAGLAAVLSAARATVVAMSKPALARVGALKSMLVAQIDLAAALLGEPSRYPFEEHLRLFAALQDEDRESAQSAVALASALRGDLRSAALLLERGNRLKTQEPQQPPPQEELAHLLIAFEQSSELSTPWLSQGAAKVPFQETGLEDLRLLVEARVNYLSPDTGERVIEQLSSLSHRVDGMPWAVAQATAFRVEMLLTSGYLAQAFKANDDAQHGPYALWPVVRLALAKTRYAQNQTEAALRIAESVWISDIANRRERARAYAIGAACASRLGKRHREESLLHELRWISKEAGIVEPFDELPDELRSRIRPTDAPRLRPRLPDPSEPMQLTERERTVLAALDEHSSAEDIASALHVSRNTVKTQLRHVYRKLSVHTREEALRAAADHGLI